MEPHSVKEFIGVPVLVQLRFPIAAMGVKFKGRLPYAREPDKSQWAPEALLEGGSPSGTQLVQFAVLFQISDGMPSTVEMRWASVPAQAANGSIIGPVATLATLIDLRDIVAITRVVDVPEASSLILKP